ncbi:hypothetical protein [Aequorivita marisscotiae]|uniref:Uncharacterized protein n=1 Tax=Aequorivita marisscotiae TaxID=3040348 RepID=A0ABY8KV24_9FLAO|nr:hypothetical protein [Aequorivita sp. Ant34-E75]WGF91557.1 hypothetical protein QCQ61_10090 [Aequorivita sp. Ant34-E75]
MRHFEIQGMDTEYLGNTDAISEEVIYDDQEGTVYYKGTGLILKYLNGEEEPVIILGQDRIKIANEEYERI